MKKEYYTQNGEKIKINEFGEVYGNNGNLGKVDKYGTFHPSQYGQASCKVDAYGYIIDANGKSVGKIGGIHGNKIINVEETSDSGFLDFVEFAFKHWRSIIFLIVPLCCLAVLATLIGKAPFFSAATTESGVAFVMSLVTIWTLIHVIRKSLTLILLLKKKEKIKPFLIKESIYYVVCFFIVIGLCLLIKENLFTYIPEIVIAFFKAIYFFLSGWI